MANKILPPKNIIFKNIEDPNVCYSLATTFLVEYITPSTGYNVDKNSILKLIRTIAEMPPTAFDTFCDLIKQLRRMNEEESYVEEN